MPRHAHLHPTLRRRIGGVAETTLLIGALVAIWISVGRVLIAAVFG